MKSKLLALAIITLFVTTFTSCGGNDNPKPEEPQETLTEKNYRLIDGNWKISMRVLDGITQDLGTCLVNNEWSFISSTKVFSSKEYYLSDNDCLFGTYNSTFTINASTLTIMDGNIGIAYNIDLLDENTLKVSRTGEVLTWNRQ